MIRVPACRTEPGDCKSGGLQPAIHHARPEHDISGYNAPERSLLQLHDTSDDWRPRRGFPTPQRPQLLDIPDRRHPAEQRLVPGRVAQRRMVQLRQSDGEHLQSRPRRGLLRGGPSDIGNGYDGCGIQFHCHHPQHASARHDADADARIRLDDPGHLLPDYPGFSGHHGGPHRASVRPHLRHQLLRPVRRGRPRALATSLLGVRASRGVHSNPACYGHHLRSIAHLLAQTPLRLPGDSPFRGHHRLYGLGASGAIICSRWV